MPTFSEISPLLVEHIARLDIPDELAAEAVSEYNRVGLWLCEANSPLVGFDPKLYPQGSFRLGTPIHAVLPADDFDIDLVCQLELSKDQTTQKALKTLIGDRLKADRSRKGKIQERRRCWTLQYQGRFHLDVLPTIPEEGHGTGVLLTDRDLLRWQFSNPIGYSEWFFDRMRPILLEARQALAKSADVDIEEIPEWRVRTPLQRAIQFMKRHRDLRFATQRDLRPVSIIITTLAGMAYAQESDVGSALVAISRRMADQIENCDGKWWIANPAHPNENFADKWNELPELRDAFLRWIDQLHRDIAAISNASSPRHAQELVERLLGTRTATPSSIVASSSPDIDDLSHLQPAPWPGRLAYSCGVNASVHLPNNRNGRVGSLGWFVKKRSSIRFVASTSAPRPYVVKWQVVNSGAEARRAGQLRGGFYDGEGELGTTRWEETQYTGTHFVEAFVVKDGAVVAKSGLVPVRISR